MTVIRPNSIAGINSITAQSSTIDFYKSDGTPSGVTLTGINLSNINELNVSGVTTVSGGFSASEGADLARLRVTGISTLGQTNITGLSNAGLSTLGDATATTLSVSGFSTLGATSTTLLNVSGIATVSGGIQGIGIQSAGITITSGIITSINFVGTGNTVQYNSSTKTVDISISGNLGAGGTFNANSVGVHTTKILGISTTNVTGAAKSEGAIQAFGNIALIEGALLTSQTVGGEITIPAGRNGLLIGPVTISTGSTVTIQTGSTLVIV